MKKRHLLTLADTIPFSRPRWEPFGRKPWRLVLADGEFIRGEPTKVYPFGPPLEFLNAADAIHFREESIAWLLKMGVIEETTKP